MITWSRWKTELVPRTTLLPHSLRNACL